MPWLDTVYYGNSLRTWCAAAGIFVLVLVSLYIIKGVLHRRLAVIAVKTKTDLDDLAVDLINKTKTFFIFFVSLYVVASLLNPPEGAMRIVRALTFIALSLQIGIWGNRFIQRWVSRYTAQKIGRDGARATTITALGFVIKLLLWSLVLLVALDNLGVNITALIAGLGITGIAVALAVQNILSDLFASLSIMLDKPFTLGDFIVVDDYMGKVEYIGLKTTRLRSLFGEQIIFSNNDLLKSRIRNYKRMLERRVIFTLSLTYDNSYERLQSVPLLVRDIVQKQPHTRFDRAHFRGYRDFALDFEIVYYVDSPDYRLYMDVQHAVNLALFRCFTERGIEFAHQASAPMKKTPATTVVKEAKA